MLDTIFAPATVRGRSAVAIVRISGPGALEATGRLTGGLPEPRKAALRWICDPDSGERLDQALVIVFPGPASFTGEDCVELQTHGSSAVVSGVLAALGRIDGLRLARPGEFTRRALLNARLDLVQIEGLGDLLAAETAAQRRQALELMDGALSSLVEGWRRTLIRMLAFIEASIDFADENLPDDLLEGLAADLIAVEAAMAQELRNAEFGERLRDGFEVALVGFPNVGKSTLLNCLARRDVALVSAEAGTTRDILEVRLDLGGMPVTVLDMAGLREASGVEAIGVSRARARAEAADLRVFLVDHEEEVAQLGIRRWPGDVVALAKADLRDGAGVSGVTGKGVDGLLGGIEDELSVRVGRSATISHERQRQAVASAVGAVGRGRGLIVADELDVAAEELRSAVRSLDFLTGRVDVEMVLDVIFASFCLGK